jgi:hypothetical protein
MFWAMAIILLALWTLGLASGAVLGPWIHLMLVLALLAFALATVSAWRRANAGRAPS